MLPTGRRWLAADCDGGYLSGTSRLHFCPQTATQLLVLYLTVLFATGFQTAPRVIYSLHPLPSMQLLLRDTVLFP